MKTFKCSKCQKVFERETEKKWIISYCTQTDQNVRCYAIKTLKNMITNQNSETLIDKIVSDYEKFELSENFGQLEVKENKGVDFTMMTPHLPTYYDGVIVLFDEELANRSGQMPIHHKPVQIICTNCESLENATVVINPNEPFDAYIHHCSKCGYVNMESDWNEIKPL